MSPNAMKTLLWKRGQTLSFWLMLVGRGATRPAAAFPPDSLEEYVLDASATFYARCLRSKTWKKKKERERDSASSLQTLLLPLQRNKWKEGKEQTKLGLFCSSNLTRMEPGRINSNQQQVLQLMWCSAVRIKDQRVFNTVTLCFLVVYQC